MVEHVLHVTAAPKNLRATMSVMRGALRARIPAQLRALHSSRPRSDLPRSPFSVFVDTLREELSKSREFQDNVRHLQGESTKIQDSETMRRAREAYERARIITSIQNNPRLQKAAEQLKQSGGQVGSAVAATLRQMEDSEIMRSLSAMSNRLRRQIDESTAPVRNTEVYKAFADTLTEAFDDGSSALRINVAQGTDAATARRVRREARLRKIGRQPPLHDVEEVAEDPIVAAAAAAGAAAGRESAGVDAAEAESKSEPEAEAEKPRRVAGFAAKVRPVQENANAGESLVLVDEPKSTKMWQSFRENSSIGRRLDEWTEQYHESENPVVERVRGFTNMVASWFEENETARVVRAFKALDPGFTMAGFNNELREYVLPEVLDAYHAGQRTLLHQWCSEATYNVLCATIDPYLQRGLIAEGRILDLNNIEILQGKMLELGPTPIPVIVLTFTTQELMYFRDPISGEVKAGNIEQANLCRYAMVLTRLESELDNELTGGWKIVELARRGQTAFM